MQIDEYIKEKNLRNKKALMNILNNHIKIDEYTFNNLLNEYKCSYKNNEINKLIKHRLEDFYDIFYHTSYCKKCKIKLNILNKEQINKIFYEINDKYAENFEDIIEIYNYCEICIHNVSKCELCNLPRFYYKRSFKYCEYYEGTQYYHNLCKCIDNKLYIYCEICNTNIIGYTKLKYSSYIDSKNFKVNYTNKNKLYKLIDDFNNQYNQITCLKYIHNTCINFYYFLEYLVSNQQTKITKIIYNKLKLLNKDDINRICNINCIMCNKKKFRLNLNKYIFESYILYLKNIKILEIKNIYIYNHFDIPHKKYTYLCYNCLNKINNNNFYNKFFFDNLENINLSEKQTKILNQIKNECIK